MKTLDQYQTILGITLMILSTFALHQDIFTVGETVLSFTVGLCAYIHGGIRLILSEHKG
jgi:hypothetical protein